MNQRRAEPAHFEKVEQAVKAAGGPLTASDVVAQTGLRPDHVGFALQDLMLTYDARLAVREDGSLVYDFGRALKRRGRRTWWDRAKGAGRFLYRAFKVGFKLWTAVMLVGYVVVFAVVIIAALIGLSVAAEDDVGVGDAVGGIFQILAEIFYHLITYSLFFDVSVDRHGYDHRTRRPKESAWQKKFRRNKAKADAKGDKSFVASVYDFIFGPERAPFDTHAQTREVVSFVRENLGLLTVGDVQALSGMGREKAETFFTHFAAEFDGEVHFDDDGTLWATFPELLESAGRDHDEPIVHYWDEYEPPFVQSGNSTGRDVAIAAMSLFNLGMGGAFAANATAWGLSAAAALGLGAVPLVFSLLFFAIPLVRAAVNRKRNHEQHLHNIRKRIFRAAFETTAESVGVKSLIVRANQQRTHEEILKFNDIRHDVRKMVEDIGGAMDTDEDGELIISLAALRREQAVAPGSVDGDGGVRGPEVVVAPQVVYETVPARR